MIRFIFFIVILTTLTVTGCSQKDVQNVVIQPIGNTMKYSVTEFTVKSGHFVNLVMDNTATTSEMKHNILILKDDSFFDEVTNMAYHSRNHIPIHNGILISTPMAEPGTQTSIKFKAPKPGRYTYMCTYPPHFAIMKGVMVVEK